MVLMFPTTSITQAFQVKYFQKYAYLCNPLHRKDEAGEIKFDFGEMAEWSNAAVLKTVDLNGSGGSNPSLSATN